MDMSNNSLPNASYGDDYAVVLASSACCKVLIVRIMTEIVNEYETLEWSMFIWQVRVAPILTFCGVKLWKEFVDVKLWN